MSTKSNRWSHLRHRHPRPAVCKSNDPYEDWPAVCELSWSGTFSSVDLIFDYAGDTPAVRVPKTFTYTSVGFMNQGDPWSAEFTVPRLGIGETGLPAFCIITIGITPPRFRIATGRGEAWPGTLPFTMTAQPLVTDDPFDDAGWDYRLL